MTTVTLKASGTPTQLPAGDAVGSIVGSGGILADGSDSTYVDSTAKIGRTTYTARATMDVLSLPAGATVASVTARARAQGVTGTATPVQFFTNIRRSSDFFDLLQFGIPFADGGWWNPTTGTITDLSVDITDAIMAEYNGSGTTVADLLSHLEGGAVVDVGAFAVSSSAAVEVRVYEFSIDIVLEGVETPCDTWVDLDLSTAVFLTGSDPDFPGPYGQYSDGVIWSVPGAADGTNDGFPDFYFAGLELDPAKRYQVTVTFDPSSAHDDGSSRQFWLVGVPAGGEETAYQSGDFLLGRSLYNGSTNALDTVTVTIGAGVGFWDDPTWGVAAGNNNIWFETESDSAVSAISIRKICSTVPPPLRLTNRDDRFSSAPSLTRSGVSRQGGNRLTGYL